MLSDSMTKQRIHASLTIIGVVVAISAVMTSITITPAFAIKYFFNCMTDTVNKHGKLTIDDVNKCLYEKYSVYRKVPYAVFSHSLGGDSSDH